MDEVKIDRKCNLILRIETPAGAVRYVHSIPISREVFEMNFIVLQRALNRLYADGGTSPMNIRLASLYLKNVAIEMAGGDAAAGQRIIEPLIEEMHRLTSVLMTKADGGGYEVLPWAEALKRSAFDDEDRREVESLLTFFMLSWHIHKRSETDSPDFTADRGWRAGRIVINAYGVRQFLDDIDIGRNFGAEGDSIVHSWLSFVSGDGFEELMREIDSDEVTAQQWRSRYIVKMIRALIPGSGG